MTITSQIVRASANVEVATRATEFLTLARALVRSRGDLLEAAADPRTPQRITEIFKSAITPGTLADPTWAGALAPYRQVSDGFVESLRTQAVFDALLPFMRRAPMRTRMVVVTAALTGVAASELSAKPVSSLALDVATLAERKSIGQIVASDELLRFASPAAVTLFNAELRAAVIAATDASFVSELIATTTPIASAGTSTANIFTDLAALLAVVTVGATSRIFLVINPARAKALVLKLTAAGTVAFPNFSISGGEVAAGVTAIVSDQIATDAALMIVADGVVADSDIVTLRSSDQADVQMDDGPDSPPGASTVPFSLWQHDSRALMAERYFAFALTRTTAVASLSGVAW